MCRRGSCLFDRVSGRLRSVLVPLCAVSVILFAAGDCIAQERPGLLERLGDLLDAAAGREQVEDAAIDVEVAAPAVPMLNPVVNRAQGEVETRQKRLDTWCLALESTLTAELMLTAEQQAAVKQVLTKEVALNQQRWKRQEHNQRPLPETTVILFAGMSGPTRRIYRAVDRALPPLLTEDQLDRLAELTEQRQQRIGNWFAVRAASVVNSELFLNNEQLQACVENLRPHTSRRSDGLYAFHQQKHYLPYEPLSSFLVRLKSVELTEKQRRRWGDLKAADPNNNHVMVTINSGADDQNEQQLDAAYQAARERFLNAAAVRTEFLTTSLQLPDPAARHLQVAGKGVTIRRLNAWKKQTREQIKQFAANQRFAPGVAIGLSGPQIQSFEQDRIWRRAVEKVCSSADTDLLRQHRQRELEGATAFVMGTLDRELTLREDQVEGLQLLVEETEPHRVSNSQYYFLELAMLARTLVRINEDQLADLLSESQMECWKLVKSQFRFQARRQAGFQTQHGEMQLILTQPEEAQPGGRGVGFF